MASGDAALDAVLADAVRLHFLGNSPTIGHRDHAMAFAAELTGVEGHIVDLGTGGGVPGLVVAWILRSQLVVCVERRERRAAFLRMAASRLELTNVVVEGRDAEELAGSGRWSGAAAVTARAFGPPDRTARTAAAFLAVGGVLVVSEPPADGSETASRRWAQVDAAGLVLEGVRPGPPVLARLRRVR